MREPRDVSPTHDIRAEHGAALLAVIGLMFVVASLIAIISATSISTVDRAQQRTERVLGRNPVDTGITSYMAALEGLEAGEHTGFLMGPETLDKLESNGYLRVPNENLPEGFRVVDQSIPQGHRYAMRRTISDDPRAGTVHGYWQMYALLPPTYEPGVGGRVLAYFRGWIQSEGGTVIGQPEMVRAELRPGRFSDYQMVNNGALNFGAGATIDGPIHSNGITGNRMTGAMTVGGHVIATNPSTVCLPGAVFSTANGSIRGCPGVEANEDTGNVISLLRVRHMMETIRSKGLCGSSTHVQVVCFVRRDPTEGNYRVELHAGGLRVLNPTGCDGANCSFSPGGSASIPSREGAFVWFDRGVNVACGGSCDLGAGQRLTIASFARDDSSDYRQSINAHSIHVHESLGSGTSPLSSLGLIAQGDITLVMDEDDPEAQMGTCPSQLHAAMISAGGGISIPGRWIVPSYEAGVAGNTCPSMLFHGSLVSHFPPTMMILRGNGENIGYEQRTYRYEPRFYDNPPPFYPTTGPWQVYDYRDADLGCFDAAGQIRGDREGCR